MFYVLKTLGVFVQNISLKMLNMHLLYKMRH